MLALQIDFIGGTYHATDPYARTTPEWPPAPDRVFQALIDAAASLGFPLEPLTALEHAPSIHFGPALPAGTELKPYVPSAFMGRPDHVEKRIPQMACIEHPVVMVWPNTPDHLADWLRPVASSITHVGRAKSLAIVRVIEHVPQLPSMLVPHPKGDVLLRAPSPGRLNHLETAFRARVRPTLAAHVGYSDPGERVAESPWGELLALRVTDQVMLRETAAFAGSLRAAVLSLAGDGALPLLHGHTTDQHVAWSVLPDVGHEHAEGKVMGVGIWLPRGISTADRTSVALSLLRLDHVFHEGRSIGIKRVAESALPRGMTAAAWGGVTRTWTSVTPVALDRWPKRKSAEEILADGCEMAGYPRPVSVETTTMPLLRGSPRARDCRPRRPGYVTHAVIEFSQPVQGPVLIGRERHFGLGLMRPTRALRGAQRVAA